MKRRGFIVVLCSVLSGALGAGCLGFTTGTSSTDASNGMPRGMQRPARGGPMGAPPARGGSSANTLRVSNIKDLSAILNRANCPLDNDQTNALLNFKTEAEFRENAISVLDQEQREAIKNDSGGGGGGGGRRR